MEHIIKDQKQMIQYLHKQAEDHVKTREMLKETNEELEQEIEYKIQENKIIKKELALKEDENMKLKKSLEIGEEIIEKLKLKDIESSRKLKEMQDEQVYSDLIAKVDKDNLEKDFLEKTEECFILRKRVDDLEKNMSDHKDENLAIKMELERKGSFKSSSSCGSLADERRSCQNPS